MSQKLQHAPLVQFPVSDDELVVGGIKVRQLATQIGQTPFYAYDRDAITRRVSTLRETLPEALSLHYAVKANPMPAVVDHIASLVDGLDIASLGELRIALDSGTAAADVSFAGPGKGDDELRGAIASGVTINLESVNEFERCLRLGEQLGVTPRVAVRVNPDFQLRASGMKMSGGAQPFGVDAEQVPALLRQVAASDVHFRGLQIFAGSQSLQADSLIRVQQATFALALDLAQHAPGTFESLNIGGGFGVPYFPGDRRLELDAIGDNLAREVERWHAAVGDTEIVLELGRYLVAEAGVYVCRVLDRKTSRGQTFLVTDGGLHHHLAASGNFGQAVRRNYPVLTAHRVYGGTRETLTVTGRLCTPLDLLAERIEIGAAGPGDLIVILQSGAYGYSASPQRFLGHPMPVEVLV